MPTRIDRRFEDLARQNRAALVTFVMAGDPDLETCLAILKALPKAGADVIELGMPFTDPMADGPAIQAAGLRAYGRMARLAAALVAPGGFLFVASCSHHAPLEAFAATVAEGIWRARRTGRILATTGAGPDHPVHPHLPESAYLKAQLLHLD